MQLPRMTTRRWLITIAVAAVIAAGVDCAVIGAAFLIVIIAARRPRPVHRTTAVLLTLVAGLLLWANLRPGPWEEEFGGVSPPKLDVVTTTLFWRGWPLSPCMFCLFHGMRFHRSGAEPCLLALDGVLFVAAIFATKTVCERGLRWRHNRDG